MKIAHVYGAGVERKPVRSEKRRFSLRIVINGDYGLSLKILLYKEEELWRVVRRD